MALQGDISTLALADLLQNLELHERDGLLEVESEHGTTRLHFQQGRLTLLAADERAKLMDVLVASGRVSPEDIEQAKKKRRRSRRSLGETLASLGVIDQDSLVAIASARLLDDACELIASEPETFRFREGKIPRGVFDPEERRLELSLRAGPMLLEAARREDHWRIIRSHIPSDSAHYVLQRKPRAVDGEGASELATTLSQRLDGTRSVTEALSCFPHQRFAAYQLLSNWFEERAIRLVEPDDMVRLVERHAAEDEERAQALLERGLAIQPQHAGLLAAKVELAQASGDLESAGDAVKMLVHLKWEAGEWEQVGEWLSRAKKVAPTDATIWDKSLALALREGRSEDALTDGRTLAELYRAPGLHKKALGVFERLCQLNPDAFELQRELARSIADCGDVPAATTRLEDYGRRQLAAENYVVARQAFAEAHALDPTHENAARTLEEIDSGSLARRRERQRRIVRRVLIGAVALCVTVWFAFEGAARRAFTEASDAVSREGLIEARRYGDAIAHFEAVAARFPLSSTALYDAPRRIEELIRKAREAEAVPEETLEGRESDDPVGTAAPRATGDAALDVPGEENRDATGVDSDPSAPGEDGAAPDVQDWPFLLDDRAPG